MQGSPQSLVKQVLYSSNSYIIPIYQRRYSWGQTQIKRLISDLLTAHEKQMENYFLGSMILDTTYGLNQSAVIDGQQRLTTMSLFMIAIRDLCPGDDQALMREMISDQYLINKYDKDSVAKNRLKPVPGDDIPYVDVLTNGDEAKPSLFKENYELLKRLITDSPLSPSEWLELVTNHVQVMTIIVQQGDDAQMIFESLNSTGLDLTESDKIRNYLLMSLPKEQQLQAFTYWQEIEGLIGTENLSHFYRDYLTSLEKSSKPTKADQVYNDYRREIGEGRGFDRIEQLKQETAVANLYARFTQPEEDNIDDPITFNLLKRLGHLHIDVINPFLIQVFSQAHAGEINADALNNVLRILLAYLARRLTVGTPTTGLNGLFATMNRTVLRYSHKAGLEYDVAFAYVLMKKVQPNKVFPSDQDVQVALQTKDFYHIYSNSFWFIIDELNNVHGEHQNLFERAAQSKYSIEHIMPRNLSNDWKNSLGSDWKNIHATWINRLANLTLTGFNVQMSNRAFLVKRDMSDGYHDSALKLNQWLTQWDRWDERSLQAREDDLFARALKAWPMPTLPEIDDPDVQEDWQTLTTGEDYTGWKINAYRLNEDAITEVGNWKDMYEALVSQLWAENPSSFYQAALDGNNLVVDTSKKTLSNELRWLQLPNSTLAVNSGWVNNSLRLKQIENVLTISDHDLSEIEIRVTKKVQNTEDTGIDEDDGQENDGLQE
ncbi:DUF262 domain-containing protein [Lacticaseibacillus mingshuiensis]|uniref:DUF262 domain-containing protein n=1 Tax=Lacticaseibacillus mingshuiensis TaxID=2799574 RepID=UPI001950DE6D|nr:DUF262 domain-containing protein [Lacticaseibacillus mingshuiensis]